MMYAKSIMNIVFHCKTMTLYLEFAFCKDSFQGQGEAENEV